MSIFSDNFIDQAAKDPAGYVWRECQRYPIHPAVIAAFEKLLKANNGEISADMRALAFGILPEWPHIPTDGTPRIAYTRNPQAGMEDRQTVGKLGGYLNRWFGAWIAGHEIEKLQQTHGQKSMIEVLTGQAIPQAIAQIPSHMGPWSCMTANRGCWRGAEFHPYQVFTDSRHGWGLAVRMDSDEIIRARCLVNDREYIRIYGSDDSGNVKGDDAALREWLESNGYRRIESWADRRFLAIERDGEYLAPWLDGDEKNCSISGDESEWYIGNGEVCFDQTSGRVTLEPDRSGEVQLLNGDWVEEDEAVYSDYHGGYLEYDDAIRIGDDFYLESARCIVQLHDSEWALKRDAVELHDGEWALVDDAMELHDGEWALPRDAVELHDGEWALRDDSVELHDGEWALSKDAVELHDGEWALRDDAVELHDGEWALRDDSVELHDGQWELETNAVELADGKYAWPADVTLCADGVYRLAWDLDAVCIVLGVA